MSVDVLGLVDRLRAQDCFFELLDDEVDVDGPDEVLTEEVLGLLRDHRDEIAELLSAECSVGIVCPWCRGKVLLDDADGVRCSDCDRLAWLNTAGGGLVRADQAEHDFEGVDPREVMVCPTCRDLCDVQRLDGEWRCSRCDPGAAARRSRTAKHLAAADRVRKAARVGR